MIVRHERYQILKEHLSMVKGRGGYLALYAQAMVRMSVGGVLNRQI